MPLNGRSADDLPLAAYSTGVDPESEPDFEQPTATTGEETFGVAAAHAAAPAFDRPLAGDDLPADPFGQAAPPHDPIGSATDRPPFRELLRNPRANARDPRLVLSGVIGVGVVLLALSVLAGGGAKGPAAADASPTAPAFAFASVAPVGDASVELTGALKGTFALTGVQGAASGPLATMDSSWGDTKGNTLALDGSVSAGTRTTDPTFVLSWTVMVEGKAVSFASKAGECTIGMAVKPSTVSGSFVCHKVKSVDGKFVVGASGTYRTYRT
jgi:hypothetical protein